MYNHFLQLCHLNFITDGQTPFWFSLVNGRLQSCDVSHVRFVSNLPTEHNSIVSIVTLRQRYIFGNPDCLSTKINSVVHSKREEVKRRCVNPSLQYRSGVYLGREGIYTTRTPGRVTNECELIGSRAVSLFAALAQCALSVLRGWSKCRSF